MRTHKYWAIAEYRTNDDCVGHLRRGSDISHADALAQAQEDARAYANASFDEITTWYDYADSNKTEPIVDEILAEDGSRAGAVTVNRCGCLILNTASLVFVDVDLAPESGDENEGGILKRLFGRKPKRQDQIGEGAPSARDRALEAIRAWAREGDARAVRIYETAGGLRYLVTAPALDPTGPESDALMERCDADRLYRNLCRAQGCYRARLTPKPYRVPGCPRVHLYAPDEEGNPSDAYLAFKPEYDHVCQDYATCNLIEQLGATTPASHADALLIALHDDHTRAESGLPLA